MLIGIPLACYLVFKADWGLTGIWFAPTICCIYNATWYVAILLRIDWAKLIEETK